MGCRFSTRVRRPVLRLIRCIARAPVTGRCSRFLRRLRFLSARSSGGWRRSTWWWAPAGIWRGPTVRQRSGSRGMSFMRMARGGAVRRRGGGCVGCWCVGGGVYVFYENGRARADASPAVSAIAGRGRLQRGVVDTGNQTVSVRAFRWGRPRSDADVATRAGWFFDLPVSGERIDQAALDLGDLSALVQSKIPPARGSGACSNALGGGHRYYLIIGNAKAG